MTTHLIRVTSDGIATDKDGRQYRLVPVEPSRALIDKGAQAIAMWETHCVWPTSWDPVQVRQMRSDAKKAYNAMLSAAAIDLAGVAVKIPSTYGWQSKGMEYDLGYKDGFTAAIDAFGVKP